MATQTKKTGVERVLAEKGFTDEQIEKITDAYNDDSLCSNCHDDDDSCFCKYEGMERGGE